MDASQIVRRFPLVARARPTCGPLHVRVREISGLACEADRKGSLSLAATAFNQAGLLASDCGLPELARTLCWRHAMVYLRTQPLGAQVARYALEPVVNLARLMIRVGDGEAAYQLLDTLFQTVKSRSHITIDGRPLSFQNLAGTEEGWRELCQWLWAVLLAEGARALVSIGRWSEALAQLQRHKGIGRRMLDGRQVSVIASVVEGDPGEAVRMLDEAVPGEPWENSVTACLAVLCRRLAGLPTDQEVRSVLDQYRNLGRTTELTVFHTRLGLSVIDVISELEPSEADCVTAELIRQTDAGDDGYATREVLAHPRCVTQLTGQQIKQFTTRLRACGLGQGVIPAAMRDELFTALDISESVLARMLLCQPTAVTPRRR